jgi:hypothetical protein
MTPPGKLERGPRGYVELAAAHVLAAAVAGKVGTDASPTAGVEDESRRAARSRVVLLAPLHQRDKGGAQLAALVGQDVLELAVSQNAATASVASPMSFGSS